MPKPISEEPLSVVREMLSCGKSTIPLPTYVVEELLAKIDAQNKKLKAYAVLVNCHDNYLCEVDTTAHASERLYRLEAARLCLESIDKGQEEV